MMSDETQNDKKGDSYQVTIGDNASNILVGSDIQQEITTNVDVIPPARSEGQAQDLCVDQIVANIVGAGSASAILEKKDKEQRARAKLFQILNTRFDKSELRTLCFHLNVDYENLLGERKEDKARELVKHLESRGRIPELLEIGRRLRPKIDWDDMS